MIKQEKTPIDMMLDNVEWTDCAQDQLESDLPHAVRTGVLNIGGVELQCAVLSNEQRIFYGETIDEMVRDLQGLKWEE